MTDGFLNFTKKRVLILGLGLHGGGEGAVEFFAREGAKITVTDLRSRKELSETLRKLKHIKGIRYVLGRHRHKDFLRADLIIKNPGVSYDSPYLKFAQKKHIPVTTDVGIFFSQCPGTIIGVTGTRGKSTTASLIAQFLASKKGGRRVFLAGNIRTSVFEVLPRVRHGDMVVLELSSFQLEDLACERKSPSVAVFTNLLRDHLNRHKNLRDYKRAKAAIFRFQGPDDYLFIHSGDRTVKALSRNACSHVVSSRLPRLFLSAVDARLGPHYRDSVGIAIAVGRHFGVRRNAMRSVLERVRPLPGREEYLGNFGGINFINDTTATIPDAAIAALKRFDKSRQKTNGRLILIGGGQDKKLIFSDFAEAIARFSDFCILLPGTATKKLIPLLKKSHYRPVKLFLVRSMAEAVGRSYALARKGDWVLLSPGAASFGLFLNEFDRGDKFNNSVRLGARRRGRRRSLAPLDHKAPAFEPERKDAGHHG